MRFSHRNARHLIKSNTRTINRSLLIVTAIFILIQLWFAIAPCLAAEKYDKSMLASDQAKADQLVKKLKATEVLGPMAPVALSPFFGLACLSGTSILADKGLLPDNSFLASSEHLNDPNLFIVFAALAVVTSAPKLFTASKLFAELTDRIETYAAIISYAAILMLTQTDAAEPQTVVYSAGVFTFTSQSLLAVAAAVNIFVISSVKYFFELLAMISPIPALDAIFEAANKTIAAILALIYAFSPLAAFILNLLIFLVCFTVFRWTNRRVNYLKAIILDPILLSLRKKVFNQSDYDPDENMRQKLSSGVSNLELIIKCFPTRKLGKIKTKDRCYLAIAADGLTLIKPRLLGSTIILPLPRENVPGVIDQGLISYNIPITRPKDKKPAQLIFSNVYKSNLEAIKTKLSS